MSGPNIAGMTQEGQTLTATATYTGIPTPTASWTWLRCTSSGASPGKAIPGATESSHRLTAADVAYRIRARLTVRNSVGRDNALVGSDRRGHPETDTDTSTDADPDADTDGDTDLHRPAHLDARPRDDLDAVPARHGRTAADIISRSGRSGDRDPSPAAAAPPVLSGAHARSLHAQGCIHQPAYHSRAAWRPDLDPVRRPGLSRTPVGPRRSRDTRPPNCFEPASPAGVRLTVQVTRPGWIGKHTTFLIRRGRPPSRVERCLYPGRTSPAPVPPDAEHEFTSPDPTRMCDTLGEGTADPRAARVPPLRGKGSTRKRSCLVRLAQRPHDLRGQSSPVAGHVLAPVQQRSPRTPRGCNTANGGVSSSVRPTRGHARPRGGLPPPVATIARDRTQTPVCGASSASIGTDTSVRATSDPGGVALRSWNVAPPRLQRCRE